MNIQVVDIPKQNKPWRWGKFVEVIAQIEALAPEKCVKLDWKLNQQDQWSLRMGARCRGYKLHIRTLPDVTYVWKGDPQPARGHRH